MCEADEEAVKKGETETVRVAWLAKERSVDVALLLETETGIDEAGGGVGTALLAGPELGEEKKDAALVAVFGLELAADGVVAGADEGRLGVDTAGLKVDDPPAGAELTLTPSTLAATVLSVQPTKTPCVVFIGMAKHCVPAWHTVAITKLPSALQFPTLPAMQAT